MCTCVFCVDWITDILLSREECADRFRKRTSMTFRSEEHLAPVGGREFLGRMLRNLKHVYLGRGDGRGPSAR